MCWAGHPDLGEASRTWIDCSRRAAMGPPESRSRLWLLYSAAGWALSSPLATTKGGRQSLRLGLLLALRRQSTEHLRLCMKQPQCMAGVWPWNAKIHRSHCSSPGLQGLGLQGMNACILPPPQQPESTVHRPGLWRG